MGTAVTGPVRRWLVHAFWAAPLLTPATVEAIAADSLTLLLALITPSA
jgi:hypothetical protein